MPTLQITDLSGIKTTLEAKSGDTLMESLRDNGYDEILAICGGVCSCSSCHVYIEPSWQAKTGSPCEDEHQLVSSTEHHRENSRLSCQITLTDDMDGMEVVIANQVY
ncbi:2Fe-2S iron-sulfur cluster binding domain-containing protein [Ketobacter sp. MCCC 1A13808]|uniref:2Fe-2S iron-sulfur cluster-binding protein n=1 Tax=Ketobacter sp. MCCC 1A13808 TaxID=2602738 RepID=UPI000F1D23C8|nr:2Fe-2S iron-sulfur cluster-binding protein [Ketobacter sp. MCCC 1A13808]MVF13832.1 2Fe-2S iron-sulfur cluster binding domain-containing protein [Ketobacter sp. MCCC 1A13808]RLP54884.1 MAG: ferredoxin [Ketobacter sp.]